MDTVPNEQLQARLRELQRMYMELADKQTELQPLSNSEQVNDVWGDLYKPYTTWLRWNYMVPSEVVPLLYFNLAVDVHNALHKKEGYVMSEPVLAWLPKLLQANPDNDSEMKNETPLWGIDRLQDYLESQPKQLLLDWHATPRGLLGGQRPRCIPAYKLETLVEGKGYSPPPPSNFMQSLAMLRGDEPLNIDALFSY